MTANRRVHYDGMDAYGECVAPDLPECCQQWIDNGFLARFTVSIGSGTCCEDAADGDYDMNNIPVACQTSLSKFPPLGSYCYTDPANGVQFRPQFGTINWIVDSNDPAQEPLHRISFSIGYQSTNGHGSPGFGASWNYEFEIRGRPCVSPWGSCAFLIAEWVNVGPSIPNPPPACSVTIDMSQL